MASKGIVLAEVQRYEEALTACEEALRFDGVDIEAATAYYGKDSP